MSGDEQTPEAGDGGSKAPSTPAPADDVVAVSDGVLSAQVVPVLEALLYAAEEPVPVKELIEVLASVGSEQKREWAGEINAMLVERAALLLSDRLMHAGSALQVLEVAGGFRLGTRPQYDAWIRALRQVERPSRLSVASLETLAVVAYRQPVTSAEIAAVRGVDPSAALRTLRDQGLVRITGRKRAVGRPFTYGTTRQFLEIFGLRDLDELPDPEEFEELLEG
jgi:segregation and condensation protein B